MKNRGHIAIIEILIDVHKSIQMLKHVAEHSDYKAASTNPIVQMRPTCNMTRQSEEQPQLITNLEMEATQMSNF